MRAVIPAHGKDGHRANGPDPIPVLMHVPVCGDEVAVTTAMTRKFRITPDLGGTYLRSVGAHLVTAGSGDTEIMVRKGPFLDSMLSDNLIIDSGDTDSYESAAPFSLFATDSYQRVDRGDLITVSLITVGVGAEGLEVVLEFGPKLITLTPPP